MGNTTVLQNLTETPEGAILFRRNIGLGGEAPCEPLHLVQYDDKLPILAAALWIGSERYIPPAGSQIRIRWKKPDGYVAYNPALGMDEDGVVYVQITKEMTAANGAAFANIEITNGGGVKNSDSIPVRVSSNAVLEGDIESEDQWLTMDEILALVQSLSQQTEDNAATASTDAQRAEVAREATETAAETVKQIVAGNEAWTKQESNDRFALALVTDTGKGTSHEIYPDPGSNVVVTAYGYTEQDGEGDPSPDNIRPINVGGTFLCENEIVNASGMGQYQSGIDPLQQTTSPRGVYDGELFAQLVRPGGTVYSTTSISTPKVAWSGAIGYSIFWYAGFQTYEENIAYFRSISPAENPLKLWYETSAEGATGRYALFKVDGGVGETFSGYAVKLNEPLCDGDYVVSQQDGQCVEVHNWQFYQFTGEEATYDSSETALLIRPGKEEFYQMTDTSIICDRSKSASSFNMPTDGTFAVSMRSGWVRFSKAWYDKYGNSSGIKQYMKEQYASGTPLTVVFNRATTDSKAKTYTHAPVPLIARPDSTGKVTVSGEKEVSAIYNKSLKKAFEELQTAILNLGGAT